MQYNNSKIVNARELKQPVHTRTASCGNSSVLNSNRQMNKGTTSNDNSHTKPKPAVNEEGHHLIVTKNMDLSWQAAHNLSNGNSVRGNPRDCSSG
jgi:hypothetical protein